MNKVAMTSGDGDTLLVSAGGDLVATIDRDGGITLQEIKATTPAALLVVANAIQSAANVARQRSQEKEQAEREAAIAQLKEQVDPELLEQAGIA